jgi:hypothetical protein
MSERLKIGMAVAAFDPQVGGSEEVVKRLALGLKGLGHDVLVATAADPKRDPRRMVVPVIEFEVAGRSATGMTGNVAAYQQFLRSADRDVWLFYAAQVWSTDAALELFGSLDAAAVVVPCGYSALRDPRYRTYFEALPGYLSHADALVYMSRGYQDYEHDVARGLLGACDPERGRRRGVRGAPGSVDWDPPQGRPSRLDGG